MNAILAFAFGVLFAFIVCAGLASAYYWRARRRVAKIKQGILQYQKAQATITAACDRAYPKSTQ